MMAALRAALAAAGLAAAAAHVSVDFNADWKFILGDEPGWPGATCPATYNVSVPLRCDGLASLGTTPSAAACLAAACASGTALYQWCGNATCDGGTLGMCWGGALDACATNGNGTGGGWVSFGTTDPVPSRPGPPPTPACPGDRACAAFDDSAWRVVRTPHDYVVEGAPVATADRNHGACPPHRAAPARSQLRH